MRDVVESRVLEVSLVREVQWVCEGYNIISLDFC